MSFDMFADLTPAIVLGFEETGAKRIMRITFDRDLTTLERTNITARLTSIDDSDLDDRARVAELVEAVRAEPESPTTLLLLRLARRSLSDQTDDLGYTMKETQ
jgi:hypothetical protein